MIEVVVEFYNAETQKRESRNMRFHELPRIGERVMTPQGFRVIGRVDHVGMERDVAASDGDPTFTPRIVLRSKQSRVET